MGFERIAEQKIREAMVEGKFDNLSGAGQRIDLQDYFDTPADLRLGYSILKSANCLPEEVELLNEIAQLERALVSPVPPQGQERDRQRLRDCRLRLAVLMERDRRLRQRGANDAL